MLGANRTAGFRNMSEALERESKSPQPSLKKRVANLSPEKLAALQKKLRHKKRRRYDPIVALGEEEYYPTSLPQRRVCFLEELQPGTPRYNVSRAIGMQGPLNKQALEFALQSLVDQHEALRTTFHMIGGEFVQKITPPSKLPYSIEELCEPSEALKGHDNRLTRKLTLEGRRTFDLSSDLMIRAALYHLAEEDHVLQITIHHLACDGWSLGLLFRDLATNYRAFLSGERKYELRKTAIRYVDFARWQRRFEQNELVGERVRWWLHQLKDAPTTLNLPIDRKRPDLDSGSGALTTLHIPGELFRRLESLAQGEGATLFMILLEVFFILMHRHAEMEDFLVGSIIAGRHRPETEEIVGFFADTVVLRADLSGNPSLSHLLKRVRQTVVNAIKHGDVPFERIVEAIQVPRNLNCHPVFQVLFNAPPQSHLDLRDLEVSTVQLDLKTTHFDLVMTYLDGTNPVVALKWNTDLFNLSFIREMLGQYATLLQAIAHNFNQLLGDLPGRPNGPQSCFFNITDTQAE